MAKLPAYVYQDKDRHGKPRFRFRKPGVPSKTLKGLPTSKEFRDQYNAALDNGKPSKEMAQRYSFEWLVGEYLSHLEKLVKNGHAAKATLKQQSNQLRRVSAVHGHRDAFQITPKAIRSIIGAMAATPGEANNTLKSMRAMYRWAVRSGMMDSNPTAEVERLAYKTTGFKVWSMADLRKFISHHPVGTKPYLCAILALCTGARRGDLRSLGPKNLSMNNGARHITFVQEKGAKEVTIPVMSVLQEAIDLIDPPNMLTFLPTSYGKVHSKAGFGNWFAARVKDAGIYGLSLHGLRKAQGALLAEMGCTQYEIMAVQGHANPRSSAVYTESANKLKLAISAIDKISGFKI